MTEREFDGNPDGNVIKKGLEKTGAGAERDTQNVPHLRPKHEKTGQGRKWRDPDSNRGHQDFQSCAVCFWSLLVVAESAYISGISA